MKAVTVNSVVKLRQIGLVLAVGASLGGCATTANNPKDPLEGFNRAMYSFNDGLDKVALKPAAKAYKAVLPSFAQTGVNNFFGNLSDLYSSLNNFLQFKGEAGLNDLTRVAVNSTFGIFGLLDLATPAGLVKHNEDFGQTLGWYGMPSGPYVVLPLFGPSTLRDTAALPVDWYGDAWSYKDPTNVRNIGTVIRVIDKRATLLDASNMLQGAALDPYEFLRDGYLQRRQNQVYDGDPPAEKRAPDDDGAAIDSPAAAATPATAAAPAAAPASL
jgi:phospholipid-binding lipoprotein MlaA